MYDLLDHNKDTADGDVVFYDGFLYIISRHIEKFDKTGFESKYRLDVKTLIPECQECYSLAEILLRFPDVIMVIHDDWLRGEIYRYRNHKDGVWEKVGMTVGFT